MFFPAATFDGLRVFPFQTDKNILVYFDLHESLLHFWTRADEIDIVYEK